MQVQGAGFVPAPIHILSSNETPSSPRSCFHEGVSSDMNPFPPRPSELRRSLLGMKIIWDMKVYKEQRSTQTSIIFKPQIQASLSRSNTRSIQIVPPQLSSSYSHLKVTFILSLLASIALAAPPPAAEVRCEVVDFETLHKMFVRNPQVCVPEDGITCCYDDGVSSCSK
jgi:hypothetical protein